jgi:type I restriction enzyme S subunit
MRAGDIAICMSSGSQSVVGKTAILRQDWPGSVGAFCAVIRPLPDRVLPDWLAFFLRSEVFRTWTRQSTGANIKNIRKSELEAFPVPVPRMAEQRRIVDILFRAEGIVRLRREAQQKAAELIPANFIDMFGDPGTNPNGWSIVPMGELVGEFRYGTSQKSGPVGVPVLRIPNVVGGAMDLTEVKLVSLATAEHERLRLLNGDLLFVRTNGNPDFVGRCSVYDSKVLSVAGFDGSECVYASYLIRARLSDSRVSPAYLQAYLSSQRGRQLLRERAKTSAGQFNLNIDGLGSLPVPVPPQSLQRKFTESVDRFASVVSQQGSAQAAAGALFRSLLARAFGAGQ